MITKQLRQLKIKILWDLKQYRITKSLIFFFPFDESKVRLFWNILHQVITKKKKMSFSRGQNLTPSDTHGLERQRDEGIKNRNKLEYFRVNRPIK